MIMLKSFPAAVYACTSRFSDDICGLASLLSSMTMRIPSPVGLVTESRKCPRDAFPLTSVCHLFDQSRLVDLIRDFSDDDLLSCRGSVSSISDTWTLHDDLALTGTVGLFGSVLAHNNGAGRKIRSLDDVGQIVISCSPVSVDHLDG